MPPAVVSPSIVIVQVHISWTVIAVSIISVDRPAVIADAVPVVVSAGRIAVVVVSAVIVSAVVTGTPKAQADAPAGSTPRVMAIPLRACRG